MYHYLTKNERLPGSATPPPFPFPCDNEGHGVENGAHRKQFHGANQSTRRRRCRTIINQPDSQSKRTRAHGAHDFLRQTLKSCCRVWHCCTIPGLPAERGHSYLPREHSFQERRLRRALRDERKKQLHTHARTNARTHAHAHNKTKAMRRDMAQQQTRRSEEGRQKGKHKSTGTAVVTGQGLGLDAPATLQGGAGGYRGLPKARTARPSGPDGAATAPRGCQGKRPQGRECPDPCSRLSEGRIGSITKTNEMPLRGRETATQYFQVLNTPG